MSSTRTRRKSAALASQLGALAIAAPQVIARRTAQMAAHGPHPDARERAEMRLMVDEKVRAFSSAWLRMAMRAWLVQPTLMSAWVGIWMTPWRAASASRAAAAVQGAMVDVLTSGLKPIQRTASSNARRLARPGARSSRR